MPYGVTPEGFTRPSVRELLDLIEAEQRSRISESLVQSTETPLGHINAIFARHLGMAWEALEAAHNGFDPDRAEDFLLTALSKLTGTQRDPATKSTTPCNVYLEDGTELIAGEHFAHVEGKPNVRFTPRENYAATATGLVTGLLFEAETTGPIAASTATLTVIATPVTGWSSVTNTEDATLGNVADTDAVLRAKREAQLAAAGSSTVLAIRADVLQLGPWVKSVTVFENFTPNTDGNGLPPHSFEVLIHDVDGPENADDLIAQAIWDTKPSGIRSYGDADESGTADTGLDSTVTVEFSRVEEVPIYISMQLNAPGFSDTAGLKSYIATQANSRFSTAGQDVIALWVKGLALDIEGVIDVPWYHIEDDPTPSGEANISIGLRQLARFDTTRISVTFTS